jgi:hypothetical protein
MELGFPFLDFVCTRFGACAPHWGLLPSRSFCAHEPRNDQPGRTFIASRSQKRLKTVIGYIIVVVSSPQGSEHSS